MNSQAARADWPEALATVLSCKYDARVGRAVAFGLPSSKHFRITYNYWANDELHQGECFTEKAQPVGTLFPIRYDPDLPHRSKDANDTSSPRRLLIAFGIAGSVILSLGWLLLLRGCSPAR